MKDFVNTFREREKGGIKAVESHLIRENKKKNTVWRKRRKFVIIQNIFRARDLVFTTSQQQLLAVSRWIFCLVCVNGKKSRLQTLCRESSVEEIASSSAFDPRRVTFSAVSKINKSWNDMILICVQERMCARECEMLCFFVYIFKNVYLLFIQNRWSKIWEDYTFFLRFYSLTWKENRQFPFLADRIVKQVNIYFC